MAKLEKWLTISNKISTFLWGGIRCLVCLLLTGILAIISVIIKCFNEDVATVLITIAIIPAGICFVFAIVELLITEIICRRILIPNYFEKQIRSTYSNKVPEITVKPIGNNDFLIKFENCTHEYVMQEKDKIILLTLQTNKEIEKSCGLKFDLYFEDSDKSRSGPYRLYR